MKNQITFILCLLFCTTTFAQSGDSAAYPSINENIIAFASSKNALSNKNPLVKDEKKLDYQTKVQRTFSVYPNPAHHWVVINTSDLGAGNYKYTIKDLCGKVVATKTMTKKSKTINLKEFEKGVYFITLEENDGDIHWVQKVTVI